MPWRQDPLLVRHCDSQWVRLGVVSSSSSISYIYNIHIIKVETKSDLTFSFKLCFSKRADFAFCDQFIFIYWLTDRSTMQLDFSVSISLGIILPNIIILFVCFHVDIIVAVLLFLCDNKMNPGYLSLAATALKPQQIPMFLHISTRVWGRRWSPHTSEQKGCMLKPQ